jgi:lysophospholipase L1-like esterase
LNRRGRTPTWAVAAVVLAGAACGAGRDAGTYVECGATDVEPSRVAILGDSLSVQAQAEYREAIDDALVDACNGRTIVEPIVVDDGLGRIAAVQASEPDWWVVALGTNDAAYGARPAEATRAHTRQLLDAIGPQACVAWVLPAVQPPAPDTAIANVAAARQVISDELRRRTCQAIVDWSAAVAAEPGLLGSDGIHLTTVGRERLADLVADVTEG